MTIKMDSQEKIRGKIEKLPETTLSDFESLIDTCLAFPEFAWD
jgi:hypothetical protein